MKTNTEEKNHALDNANSWLETIMEQVNALETEWDRYGELKEMDAVDMTDEEKAELAELTETAGEFENQDAVRERIEEGPLSVQVRSGWYAPGGEQDKPEEFEILLSTGGPALRILGDLDNYGQPNRPRLQYQDWFTAWTERITTGDENEALEKWCSVFYFGE
jgi:hypothetical protein